MPDLTCPACGSQRVIPDVAIIEYSSTVSPLRVQVPLKNPESTSLLGVIPAVRDRMSGTLEARICGDCGHADVFSPEFRELWKAYSGEV
jgi:hypothetical protein